MTHLSLEDLNKTLQAARDKTQQALDQYEVGVLSRVINVDEAGKPAFVVWECRLPSGDGGERNCEMLRLPWNSFVESETTLKQISVAFDCEISRGEPTDNDGAASYALRPSKAGRSRPLHRFEMTLEAESDYVAEATMDGLPIDVFLEQPEIESALARLPFHKELWRWIKGMKIALLQLLAMLSIIAAPIVGWLYYTGQI